MRALRGWWNGLRPGDRRLAGLFVGMIAATLPFYVVGAVLATDYGGRLAQRADRSADPESAAMTPRTPSPTPASSNGSPPVGVAASPIPQPTPPPGPTSTLAPSPTARPTAPASLTEVPRAGATPGARNGSAGGQSGPAATVGGLAPHPCLGGAHRSPPSCAANRCPGASRRAGTSTSWKARHAECRRASWSSRGSSTTTATGHSAPWSTPRRGMPGAGGWPRARSKWAGWRRRRAASSRSPWGGYVHHPPWSSWEPTETAMTETKRNSCSAARRGVSLTARGDARTM
jgi:hypothetical protein